MPLLLVALFIIVPIAELAVIIQVGQAIGVWWTIAILIADSRTSRTTPESGAALRLTTLRRS